MRKNLSFIAMQPPIKPKPTTTQKTTTTTTKKPTTTTTKKPTTTLPQLLPKSLQQQQLQKSLQQLLSLQLKLLLKGPGELINLGLSLHLHLKQLLSQNRPHRQRMEVKLFNILVIKLFRSIINDDDDSIISVYSQLSY